MNIAVRKPWTLEQFLAWEERQEMRYEFDGVGPVAMTGGTEAHAMIQVNLLRAVGNRPNRPPCRIVGSELKLIAAGHVRYPDAMILCSPAELKRTVVSDPVIVFEIMSPSSVGTDMIHKNAEYRATPSIRRHVILEQTSVAAMMFTHKGDDWVSEIVEGRDVILRLPEVGIAFPLGELYRDLEFLPEGETRTEV